MSQELDEAAADRQSRHGTKPGRREFASINTDRIGLAGEAEFARVFGIPIDLRVSDGDGGTDFKTPVGTVDVKTFTQPHLGLLVEKSKCRADIFVLAGFDIVTGQAWLDGWAWRCEVVRGKDFDKRGIYSYWLKPSQLRSISNLRQSIRRRMAA